MFDFLRYPESAASRYSAFLHVGRAVRYYSISTLRGVVPRKNNNPEATGSTGKAIYPSFGGLRMRFDNLDKRRSHLEETASAVVSKNGRGQSVSVPGTARISSLVPLFFSTSIMA